MIELSVDIGEIGYCCRAEGGNCNRPHIEPVDARPARHLVTVIDFNDSTQMEPARLVSPVTR